MPIIEKARGRVIDNKVRKIDRSKSPGLLILLKFGIFFS